MNNKGQSLVLFILLIPILICCFTLIFDSALIIAENNRLINITNNSLKYLIEDNKNIKDVEKYISKNDKNIKILEITNDSVHLKKHVTCYFGKIIGYEYYEFETNYEGYIEDGVLKIINRKG